MMMQLYPGTTKRFTNVVTDVRGVRVSVPLTFEVRSQDGSVVLPGTVVSDADPLTGLASVGSNYADVFFPLTAPPGVWTEHWAASNGVQIDPNRNDFVRFRVLALPP